MILISKLFGNLFITGEPISEDKFRIFSSRHLVRIAHYNTTGQYALMLTDTQNAYTAFFGEILDEDVNKALQKSRTSAVDLFINGFRSNAHNIHVIIEGVFPKGTPELLEFYPHGNEEFLRLNKTDAPVLLNRLKTGVNTYSTSFQPAFVSQINGYVTTFNTLRGTQEVKKEDVKDYILTTAEKREVLEKQFTKNIHTLAIDFIDEPEKGIAFFDLSIIRPPKTKPEEGDNSYILTIPKASKAKAGFSLQYGPDYYLAIANNNDFALPAYSSANADGEPVPENPYVIAELAEVIIDPDELGANGNPYLFFVNNSPDTDAEVSITIVSKPS